MYRKEVSRIASRVSPANNIEVSLLLIDRQSFVDRLNIYYRFIRMCGERVALYGYSQLG